MHNSPLFELEKFEKLVYGPKINTHKIKPPEKFFHFKRQNVFHVDFNLRKRKEEVKFKMK